MFSIRFASLLSLNWEETGLNCTKPVLYCHLANQKPRRIFSNHGGEASSQSKFIDVIRLGSDVVTMNNDLFSLKEEWIESMCNPVVPCRHDLNSYRSFKHAGPLFPWQRKDFQPNTQNIMREMEKREVVWSSPAVCNRSHSNHLLDCRIQEVDPSLNEGGLPGKAEENNNIINKTA